MLREGTLINGYEVLGPIGAGGFGSVYRARHLDTLTEVALKVPHRATPSSARRFLEEARALARASHPGVVRVLDFGLCAALPYCAMELVAGESLAEWLWLAADRPDGAIEATLSADTGASASAARGVSSPAASERQGVSGPRLEQALGWMAELCETLTFLHDEGIVHGDIKPSNVIVASGEPPRLVDFGIASFGVSSGREVPGLFTAGAGTRSYSAPERLSGTTWDGRADLYSLGCILYELVLGSPPCSPGGDPARFASRASAAGLAPPAIDVILSLLSSDARLRPRRADAVRLRLGAAPDRIAARPLVGRWRLPRPALVGRAELLQSLAQRLRAHVDGAGGMIAISGPSGVGKTRLLSELLAQSGALVVISDATSDVTLGPMWQRWGPLSRLRPVLHALMAEWSSLEPAEQQALCGPGMAWISGHEPALLPLLGGNAGVRPALRPEEVRELLFAWFVRALEILGRRRGLLLIIDDLQWSDDLSLELLARLARARPLSRVAVLAAARLGAPEALVEALLQAPSVHHEALSTLAPEQVVELSRQLLDCGPLPPRFAEQVVERAEGNPFLLIQLLEEATCRGAARAIREEERGARQRGALGEVDVLGLELCHSLEQLLETRLAGLSGSARAALDLAAVLGTRFAQRSLLEAAVDLRQTREALHELRRARLLDDTAGEHVCFVHDSFRDAVYTALSGPARAALHERAFVALRGGARGARARLDDLLALSHHARLAGRRRSAVRLLRRAALRLTRLGALEQARSLLETALCSRAGSADLLEQLGLVLARLGRYEQAAQRLEEALENLTLPRAQARLCRELGRVYTARQEHGLAERALHSGLARVASIPASLFLRREWLAGAIDLFWVHYFRDDRAAMTSLLSRMASVTSRGATRRQQAVLHELRTLLALRQQRYVLSPDVVENAREACELLQASRDALERARARFQLGLARLFSGQHELSRRDLADALEQARAHGDTLLEARSLTYLAVALRRAGELGAVAELAERALALTEAARLGEYVATAHANLSWVALRRGDPSGAAEHATLALAGWARSPVVYPLRWLAGLPLLDLALASGDGKAAGKLARELLGDRQMRLPAPLTELLERLSEASERSPDAYTALLDELRRCAEPVERLGCPEGTGVCCQSSADALTAGVPLRTRGTHEHVG